FDRGRVERVELGDVRRASIASDALGDPFEARSGAAGEGHLGALADVRSGDRGADRSRAAVDDRGLLLEPHAWPPQSSVPSAVSAVGRGSALWGAARIGADGGLGSGYRGTSRRPAARRARSVAPIWRTYSLQPSQPAWCCWNSPRRSRGSIPSRWSVSPAPTSWVAPPAPGRSRVQVSTCPVGGVPSPSPPPPVPIPISDRHRAPPARVPVGSAARAGRGRRAPRRSGRRRSGGSTRSAGERACPWVGPGRSGWAADRRGYRRTSPR